MAEALLGGATVKTVFVQLLKAVLEIKGKANMFKKTLIYLRSTLVAIDPVIKEIEQHNNDLGRPKEELESLISEMEEGTKLVWKCSKIHRLNYLAKVRHQEKLVALGDSLVKFFIIDMQAQIARDQKETLLKVRRLLSAVNKSPWVNREDTVASSSDSVPMPVVVRESETHYSSAMETISETVPVDVNASGSTETQQAEDAAGTNFVEQVMEPITGTNQEAGQSKAKEGTNEGMKHLVSEKSNDQLHTNTTESLPKIGRLNRQVKKATSIKQNNKLDTGDDKTSYNKQVRPNKLVFLYSSYGFDLEDLLRASAEVLGKGSYGTTYKAILKDGSVTVAVKRLKEVNLMKRFKEVKLSKIEFEKQVEILKNLLPEHPNVCPLRAYYCSSDEILLIYDYIAGGSFSALMHGRWKSGWTQLDWNSRMKISLGVARDIAHIHSVSGMNFLHGNIKLSNVLVTTDFQGCISDFGLTHLLGLSGTRSGNKGYQAPEVIESGKLTQKSDVYSFGIILLVMLTGKSPEEDPYLQSWVELQAGDGLLYTLFDDTIDSSWVRDMGLHMMRLARACASWAPDKRPSMDEVVKKMEGLITSNQRN